MQCPIKEKTFTTEPECNSKCAWYIDGNCAVTLIADGLTKLSMKGDCIGLRFDDEGTENFSDRVSGNNEYRPAEYYRCLRRNNTPATNENGT